MIRIMQKLAIVAAALALVLAFASFANSQPAPERHGNYLHALADLRFARALISNPDSGQIHDPERQAMEEIDAAIQELKAATIDDGKDLNDHPGIDSHLRWIPRLNKAAKVLDNAHDEAAKEEDDPSAQGLQGRILEHIGKARRHVEEAIATEQ
ncbi:MAG: hypothetical protein WA369_16680 [Candidatus Acidiferrales bacterium]